MKVREAMTRLVDSIRADQTIAEAAILMAERDIGALPVLAQGKLAGIVTDRDLVIRGVAEQLPSDTPLSDVMTAKVHCCYPDDDIDDALRIMADEQVRRVPVCDGSGMLVGMITLADAARHDHRRKDVALTLSDICQPLGDHCQSISEFA